MSNSEKFERGVNRQIEEAQRRGAFDNLPGKGKPLKLDANPNADPERNTAYTLLNDNNFLLPWMEKGQQIDRDLEAARKSLAMTWDLVRQSEQYRAWADSEWERACEQFRARIAAVNKLIRNHNLEIPHLRFERFVIDPEVEIRAVSDAPAG